MNLNELVFIDNLPKLDIHGLDQMSAVYYINEFIAEQLMIGNRSIAIVHGIGANILMHKTHETLAQHDAVLTYKLWMFNRGVTVVELTVVKK